MTITCGTDWAEGHHDVAWTEFNAILDRPAERIPELAKLLHEPAPWDK